MKKPPAGKPIISLGYMTRMQIDLIDMTSRPDHDYKWILHMRDHFSKFSWTHPLTSKRAAEVAEKLVQTFCLFGAPHILQSDNGKEFVAGVINELTEKWPGLVIIHGRPRHPQSQGSVERGNGDLQLKLGKWLEEHPEKGWAEGLHHITYAINTSVSATTKKSPYEVVFGQSPRTHCAELEILADQGIQHEEDATDFFNLETRETGPQLMTQPEPAINQTAVSSLLGPSISLQPLNQPEASTSQGNTVESTKTREVPAKRGREYHLLHGARMVAVGMEFCNQEVVHGQTIDPQYQGAFQVTSVIDQDFVPTSGNPFEEPLSEGQFVIWDLASTAPVELLDTPHSKVRKIATDNYLKAANRQQVNFDAKAKNLVKTYSIGDTVGIRINEVDRTNTDPRVLPCKVMEVNQKGQDTIYKIYTAGGILKNRFKSEDLVDMRNVCFPSLQNLDVETLEEVTLIQASRKTTGWQATTTQGSSVCACKGSCVGNRCKCKKAGIPCSTKCHPSSVGVCQNRL
jgi:hypothetical protein